MWAISSPQRSRPIRFVRPSTRAWRVPGTPWWRSLAGLLLVAPLTQPAQAQTPRWDFGDGLLVGSEAEDYLRTLQVAGLAPLYPWAIRPLSPWQAAEALPTGTIHPWDREAWAFEEEDRGLVFGRVATEVALIGNTAFPHGEQDGIIWAGRGLTTWARTGVFLRWGRLHLRLAPEFLLAQNAGFDLTPNGQSGEGALRDPREPDRIDLPQRFGDGAYSRVDPGASSLALRLPGVTLGAGTAAQHWGPGIHYPLLLSDNAGGFPHLFLQASRPVPIGIGWFTGRFVVGRLRESEWSPPTPETRRLASAAVLSFRPRWASGLEVGVQRFIHVRWPEAGVAAEHVLRAFSLGLRSSMGGEGANVPGENQLAGAFVRWSLPAMGVEAYGELLRDDFNRDLRHYLVVADDWTTRVFGIQRAWKLEERRILSVRAEVLSGLVHHSERADWFREVPPNPRPNYWHVAVRQGHTHRGQLLAASSAYGQSAWTLGAHLYTPQGRRSLELFRSLQIDWHRGLGPDETVGAADVIYGIRLEQVQLRGRWEVVWSLSPMVELNRSLQGGSHAVNLNASIQARMR